jgi:hypothetical protein
VNPEGYELQELIKFKDVDFKQIIQTKVCNMKRETDVNFAQKKWVLINNRSLY